MDNTNNVAQAEDAEKQHVSEPILRPNILIPADLWREVKKAAIDAGISQSQWLAEAANEKLSHVKQQ